MREDGVKTYRIGDAILFDNAAKMVLGRVAPNANEFHKHMLIVIPLDGWRKNPVLRLDGTTTGPAKELMRYYTSNARSGVMLLDAADEQPRILGEISDVLHEDIRLALDTRFAIGARHTVNRVLRDNPVNGQILTYVHGIPDVFVSFACQEPQFDRLSRVRELLREKPRKNAAAKVARKKEQRAKALLRELSRS